VGRGVGAAVVWVVVLDSVVVDTVAVLVCVVPVTDVVLDSVVVDTVVMLVDVVPVSDVVLDPVVVMVECVVE
jgi:hypothetical protein